MSSFCKQCSEEEFGNDSKDFIELCDEGQVAEVVCTGCGPIYVNCEGARVAPVEDV